MAHEERDFVANLEKVAQAMNQKTVWFVAPEKIVKITKDNPNMAIYAAHIGNVTIVCKAYRNGTFLVRCIGW